MVPDPGLDAQIPTLVAAGQGYCRAYAHDLRRRAALLEPLGPSLEDEPIPPEAAIEVLVRTLRQAWRVPPWPGLTVDMEHHKARQLHELVSELWETMDQPCPRSVVDQALDFARQRAAAFEPTRCVVAHGDPHPGNLLRVPSPRPGAETGYAFIDPDGFLAEPAYDLGVVLREWCTELLAGDAVTLARRYCRLLAEHSGVDVEAIWQWGYLERVSSGLYLMRLGAEELARPFLVTAERLVDFDWR